MKVIPQLRRCGTLAIAFSLACASLAVAQTLPRNILLLGSFEHGFAPQNVFEEAFRREMARQASDPIAFVEVSLPAEGVSETRDAAVLNYLTSTFAGRNLDLIVTMGGPAAAFAQTHRDQLFPDTPRLFASVDQRFVRNAELKPDETAVAVAIDAPKIIETIVGLLPDVKTIAVVIGSSELERFWASELTREFQRFSNRVKFVWFNEISFEEMLKRSASLPPHSALFFANLIHDGRGMARAQERALAELKQVANAPLFGVFGSQLGQGIVGGPLLSLEDLGRETAAVAVRILRGEPAGAIKPATLTAGAPQFDWRELQRWGISETRLPSGSVVVFREPTAWQRYRPHIIAALSIGLVETLLVIGLLTIQIKRRRAERLLRESEGRFRLLADTAPVMIWMAGKDNGWTDVNRAWLEFTGRTTGQELGNGWSGIVHPDDVDACLNTYVAAFERREPFSMEFRLRRFDGEYRWVLDAGTPRFTGDGSFLGYTGSVIDVTDHKLAQTALSNLSQKLMQAQERERAWIARELHDDVCQRIVGLTVQLHNLSNEVSNEPGDLQRAVLDVSLECRELGTYVQTLSHRLHSSKLEYLGLAAAANALCRELSSQHGVNIRFSDDAVPKHLEKETSLCLFRVLQEALTNAIKHSGAREFDVTLRGTGRNVELEVVDRGAGFDARSARKRGLGLVSMRERLSLIGGELFIMSHPGRGTTVRACAPLHTPAAVRTLAV